MELVLAIETIDSDLRIATVRDTARIQSANFILGRKGLPIEH